VSSAGGRWQDGRVPDADAHEAYVEQVLAIVELIPSGRATTYGAVADAIGRGGPRQVGRTMAMYGGGVPWWRVVRADGSLPESHQREALAHYREEGTPVRGRLTDAASLRVDLAACGWFPADA
jgi:alkylated DNA nucleotide flippase Atl1